MAKKAEVKSKLTGKTTTRKTKSSNTTKKVAVSKSGTTKKSSEKKVVVAKKAPIKATGKKKVAPKKVKGYPKKELAVFKKIIFEKRTAIVEHLQNLKDQMIDSTTGLYVNENSPYSLHMAEQGTDAQEREKLYLWAQRESKFLAYLEDALVRIEKGTYGICLNSIDSPEGQHLVPKERLLAVPHTQLCVACKNKEKIGKL